MSGLNENFPGFGPGYPGAVAPRDIDEYHIVNLSNPSVDRSYFGTVAGGTVSVSAALTLLNTFGDSPRNAYYSTNGVAAGTFGGTFSASFLDQFGQTVSETVVVPSGTGIQGVFGTAIVYKFLSGTFQSQGSSGGSAGTASIGYGTTENGSAQSNWFGLFTKVGGTGDLVNIRWVNNGTPTGVNQGTNLGTLIDATRHAFQGTSGVAITDSYVVTLVPTYDNAGKPAMAGL